MSLQKFIDSLPASITKYQGFAVGRHTRALRDPELRKHPLLILGYQTQRKALKFQPVVFSLQKFAKYSSFENREPWSSWEHGYHININALSKILTPKSRPENITASNLLFNSAAHIRFVRGNIPTLSKLPPSNFLSLLFGTSKCAFCFFFPFSSGEVGRLQL